MAGILAATHNATIISLFGGMVMCVYLSGGMKEEGLLSHVDSYYIPT
jgi:hypothetical protein